MAKIVTDKINLTKENTVELETQITEKTKALETLTKQTAEKTKIVEQLEAQTTEKTKALETLSKQTAEKTKAVEQLDLQISAREKLLEQIIKRQQELEQEKLEPIIDEKVSDSNPDALRMPNLIGITETLCSQILLSFGLNLDSIYQYTDKEDVVNGQSIKQSIPAGNIINGGETVAVVFVKK